MTLTLRLGIPAAALILAIALSLGGCSLEPMPRNVILISIDTLRADHLGLYGHYHDTSPRLDEFSEKAVIFDNAVAESSWTLPTHVSMLSGLHPSRHRVVRRNQRAPDEMLLLSEVLHDNGFQTLALVGGGFVSARRGLAQGYDTFDLDRGDFPDVLEKAQQQLTSLDPERPFFAFLHTFDVHCPYSAPKELEGIFQSPGAEPTETKGRCSLKYIRDELTPGQALYVADRYDEGIRAMDEALGSFFDFLEAEGLLKDTIVVLTSDHGEEFLENGRIGHGWGLQHEVLDIPLIIRSPGGRPKRSATPAALIDVMPTVLDLPGLEVVNGTVTESNSSRPLVSGLEAHRGRFSFRQASLVLGRYQLIVDRLERTRSLYDLEVAPGQREDLSAAHPEEKARLEAELWEFLRDSSRTAMPTAPAGPLTQEERARLEALGYLGD